MRRFFLCCALVVAACQKPPAETQVAPQPSPPPTVDPAVIPISEPEPPPAPKRCVELEPWQERDACLAKLQPASGFESTPELGEPFGYICVLFGGVGGKPRCADSGNVRVLARWAEESDPCPLQLNLYFAPMQPPSGPGSKLGEGAPGQKLEPFLLPSDGSVFGYLRLDNFMLEAKTCEDRGDAVGAALEQWGEALRPQIFE